MSYQFGGQIITSGLVFYYDYANVQSYPGTGTTILDLSGNNNVGLVSNYSLSTLNVGIMSFSGSNTYGLTPQVSSAFTTSYTYNVWVYINSVGVGSSCILQGWVVG